MYKLKTMTVFEHNSKFTLSSSVIETSSKGTICLVECKTKLISSLLTIRGKSRSQNNLCVRGFDISVRQDVERLDVR